MPAAAAAPTVAAKARQNTAARKGSIREFIAKLEKQFGFDKPPLERFGKMLWDYARFDFGDSYFRDISVLKLILEKMPVSISLGLWITLLSYLISIPLGIRKAVKDGSTFDVWTSGVVIIGYAIPGFLFAILLMVLFAGGSFFDWFPLRGLTSENLDQLSIGGKILDYFWHLVAAADRHGAVGLRHDDAAHQELVPRRDPQAICDDRPRQGPVERQVLYGHVFRNAMLIVIAGFPGAFISAFFTGSLLIENIFSLDGLGLLGFRSVLDRDYPVVFAKLYIFSLLGPGRQPDLRPHLHLDRSAHRFRAEGRLMAESWPRRTSSAPGKRPPVAVAAQPAALAEFQGQPARLLVAVDIPVPVRAVAVCRIDRQRQADHRLLQGRDPVSGAGRLPRGKVRRLLCRHRLSRPGHPGRDQGQWLAGLAAGPLLLPHGQRRHSGGGAGQAFLALRPRKKRCSRYPLGVDDPNCTLGNWNWLGTDDQARDVLARVIYGFRISVLFGLILTIASAVIGVAAGALQGYFGG